MGPARAMKDGSTIGTVAAVIAGRPGTRRRGPGVQSRLREAAPRPRAPASAGMTTLRNAKDETTKRRNSKAWRPWSVVAGSLKGEAAINGNQGARRSPESSCRQSPSKDGRLSTPDGARNDGAGPDRFSSVTRLGRCGRPENRPQVFENMESAPGISPARSPKRAGRRPGRTSPRNAEAGRPWDDGVRFDGSWLLCPSGRWGRPQNRLQGLENIDSAPGIPPGGWPKRACRRRGRASPRDAQAGRPCGDGVRLAGSWRRCPPGCCDRPENRPQALENMESAPGILPSRSPKRTACRLGRGPPRNAEPRRPGSSGVRFDGPWRRGQSGRSNRPENRPQSLENIDSAPGISGRSPKLAGRRLAPGSLRNVQAGRPGYDWRARCRVLAPTPARPLRSPGKLVARP